MGFYAHLHQKGCFLTIWHVFGAFRYFWSFLAFSLKKTSK